MKHDRGTSRRRHVAVAALVGCLAFGAMGGSTFAGKPSGGGGGKPRPTSTTSSLKVVMVDDVNLDGAPNWGDTITFAISTTATTQPNVSLTCSQGGVVVYGASAGFYEGYPWPWTVNMKLASNAWAGGAANCVAVLQQYSGSRVIDLASIAFTAGA